MSLSAPAPVVSTEGTERPPRASIRDAATLVVVDTQGGPARILVGRRAGGHVFMPGKLVFPGGRIDRADVGLASAFDLGEPARHRLLSGVRTRFAPRRAVALALAAIRETYEETGVMIGRADEGFSSTLPFWNDFARAGVVPTPLALVPFARAITPPGRVRRYDTRFFAVDAAAIGRQVPFAQRPTDEFDLVRWIEIEELLEEDLAPITRRIVGDLSDRLARETLFDAGEPMPFYRRRGKSFLRVLL